MDMHAFLFVILLSVTESLSRLVLPLSEEILFAQNYTAILKLTVSLKKLKKVADREIAFLNFTLSDLKKRAFPNLSFRANMNKNIPKINKTSECNSKKKKKTVKILILTLQFCYLTVKCCYMFLLISFTQNWLRFKTTFITP